MKKALVSILAIVYLSTSMGATVHFHYCMGKLASWGLIDHEGKTCGFCGMQKKAISGECAIGMTGCCHDESKQIKNDKDQKPGQEFFLLTKLAPAVAGLPRSIWTDALVVSPVFSHPIAHGPPPPTLVPVFLRNRSFRI